MKLVSALNRPDRCLEQIPGLSSHQLTTSLRMLAKLSNHCPDWPPLIFKLRKMKLDLLCWIVGLMSSRRKNSKSDGKWGQAQQSLGEARSDGIYVAGTM